MLTNAPFEDEHLQKIHRWLAAPDPSSNHNAACGKRQLTTGSWFVGGSQFARWKAASDSMLWLYGIRMLLRNKHYSRSNFANLSQTAGCGKTILWQVKSTLCVTRSSSIT